MPTGTSGGTRNRPAGVDDACLVELHADLEPRRKRRGIDPREQHRLAVADVDQESIRVALAETQPPPAGLEPAADLPAGVEATVGSGKDGVDIVGYHGRHPACRRSTRAPPRGSLPSIVDSNRGLPHRRSGSHPRPLRYPDRRRIVNVHARFTSGAVAPESYRGRASHAVADGPGLPGGPLGTTYYLTGEYVNRDGLENRMVTDGRESPGVPRGRRFGDVGFYPGVRDA